MNMVLGFMEGEYEHEHQPNTDVISFDFMIKKWSMHFTLHMNIQPDFFLVWNLGAVLDFQPSYEESNLKAHQLSRFTVPGQPLCNAYPM